MLLPAPVRVRSKGIDRRLGGLYHRQELLAVLHRRPEPLLPLCTTLRTHDIDLVGLRRSLLLGPTIQLLQIARQAIQLERRDGDPLMGGHGVTQGGSGAVVQVRRTGPYPTQSRRVYAGERIAQASAAAGLEGTDVVQGIAGRNAVRQIAATMALRAILGLKYRLAGRSVGRQCPVGVPMRARSEGV